MEHATRTWSIVRSRSTFCSSMLRAMTLLLGFQPTWSGGAWIWDVRHLVDDPDAVLTGPDIG